ncbi:hypothetical protein BLA60_39470 [Actinophytocola xinjiangensis]|uniref:AAA domain-containing protein n=1 Tax=Actinophytocola xinjiangensis TaxID=485602 RepID=A0A7Z0WDY0_9PSEU|nr:hypothetical protein BLA60_39470 [Actinophytocola xinjiangensis]
MDEIVRRGEVFDGARANMSDAEYDDAVANLRRGWDTYRANKQFRRAVEDHVIEVFDQLVESNHGRNPARVVLAREAFDGSVWDDSLLDMPSVDEPLWGRGDHQLWTPGDPGHFWGPSGAYKTGAFGIPLAAFRSGAAQDMLGHSNLWGFPVKPTQGGVAYLAWDRERQIMKIASRYSRFLGADLKDYVDFIGLTPERREAILGNPASFIDWLLDHEIDTLFVDSLQNVVGIEYGTGPLQQYLNFLKLCSRAGIETQTINHAIKPGYSNGQQNPSAYRGSQVIQDQIGTSLTVKRKSNETDEYAYLTVTMDKASVESVGSISLRFDKALGHPEVDEDAEPEQAATPNRPGRRRRPSRVREVAEHIENATAPVPTRGLGAVLGMSNGTAGKLVDELREGGYIVRSDDDKGWISARPYGDGL